MDKRAEYLEEVKKMFNHICLVSDSEIVRCVGMSEDVLDLYYICIDRQGKRKHYSMVGPCISLMETYPRYSQLERIFELNGGGQYMEFVHEIADDATNWKIYKIKTVNGVVDEEWMTRYKDLMDELP